MMNKPLVNPSETHYHWIMRIALITVGKCRQACFTAGIADYTSRINRYAKLDFKAVREERIGRSVNPEEIRQKEANRLLEALPKGAYTVALDPKGEMCSSVELSNRISKLGLEGKSLMAFFIGGALGLSSHVVNAANWKLSLSSMTFPHEMAQLILLEQLYRAFTIQRGEKYHK